MTILLALDRATVRRRDANGYLHVEISNISKANVCEYSGAEIPADGLTPDRLYRMYRDPEELAKGASTFNNIPVLHTHEPVDPDNLPRDLFIGNTGTDAAFDAPYLRNSLVIYDSEYQDAIEAGRQRELSCGYRYRADMTPGTTPDGLQYDGVMRDIMGNHVALVIEGRAGPDVMVGDELMKLKSRTALMISGALAAHVRPRLAADAKVDISTALAGVDAKSFAMDGAPKKLAAKVVKLVTPHLAQDATIDGTELATFLQGITPLALDEDKIEEAEDEDDDDKPKAEDEDPDAKKDCAEDEDNDDDDDKPKGMDAAAVRKLVADAEARGAKRVAAIEIAKRDVQPLVGEIVGMDSAESIYAFALDSAGIGKAAIKGAPISTLRAMTAMAIEKKVAKPLVAQDSATITNHRSDFAQRYPNRAKLVRS